MMYVLNLERDDLFKFQDILLAPSKESKESKESRCVRWDLRHRQF